MSQEDYYKTLGVDRSADAGEIKKAYRKLAMQYHPDRNPDNAEAEQKFKEVSLAYEILKDAEKRKAYDRFGHEAFEGGAGGFDPSSGFAGGFDFSGSGFSDIFEDLFGEMGGGGRKRQATMNRRGADLRYNLEISLDEAFNGEQQNIRILTAAKCDTCEGTGSEDKAAPVVCDSCAGSGRVRMQQGFFTIERTCATCQGTGYKIENGCNKCEGSGRSKTYRNLAVNVPAGVEEGTRIRLSGEGEAGIRGGEPGDLYIFVSIKPHKFFKRDGADINCTMPVKMTTAALGGMVEVPTLEGKRARITVPAGTQTHDKFRLKGKGMPIMRSTSTGDMYVHVLVETPVKLDKKQKELLEQFDEMSDKRSSPKSEGFFDKIKELWDDIKE
jgi:molecular chaperone DnaJ